MSGAAHRFRVGELECTVLSDGSFDYPGSMFVENAEEAEIEKALVEHGDSFSCIVSPYTCLLVETQGKRVLLDTGGGALGPNTGKLQESLRVAGLEPGDIDIVAFSHAHPDHLGGNTNAEGEVVFSNARHVIARKEWEHWASEDVLTSVPEIFSDSIRKDMLPLADRIELVDDDCEVAPGIRMLPTPGHTIGHVAVVVSDGPDELLFIADAAIHPVHLEHPDWRPHFEYDPEQALASKRMLFDRAADKGSLVHAFHFKPFPCLGHVSRAGQGWSWEPLPLE